MMYVSGEPAPRQRNVVVKGKGERQNINPFTYIWSPFSKLTVECHLHFLLVPSSLVKGMTSFKRWAVQMEAHGSFCMAWVLHTVQANGVYTIQHTGAEIIYHISQILILQFHCTLFQWLAFIRNPVIPFLCVQVKLHKL